MESRSQHRYQPYYCEENVWHLCQHDAVKPRERQAVFISNRLKACPHWNQRASASAQVPIFWDYHAVLLVSGAAGWEIWDLDCLEGMPLPAASYLAKTFGEVEKLRPVYRPSFRVIPSAEYVATLSSDRSHMRDADGRFTAPPPSWPAITQGENNLERHYDMRGDFVGEVLNLSDFQRRFG